MSLAGNAAGINIVDKALQRTVRKPLGNETIAPLSHQCLNDECLTITFGASGPVRPQSAASALNFCISLDLPDPEVC